MRTAGSELDKSQSALGLQHNMQDAADNDRMRSIEKSRLSLPPIDKNRTEADQSRNEEFISRHSAQYVSQSSIALRKPK